MFIYFHFTTLNCMKLVLYSLLPSLEDFSWKLEKLNMNLLLLISSYYVDFLIQSFIIKLLEKLHKQFCKPSQICTTHTCKVLLDLCVTYTTRCDYIRGEKRKFCLWKNLNEEQKKMFRHFSCSWCSGVRGYVRDERSFLS